MMRSRAVTLLFFFFFNDTATTEIYTLSLHDALPILQEYLTWRERLAELADAPRVSVTEVPLLYEAGGESRFDKVRSEEHTSELQSPCNLVCRLLLEKKKKKRKDNTDRHKKQQR